jgi:hypothetical protein
VAPGVEEHTVDIEGQDVHRTERRSASGYRSAPWN